MQTIDFWKIAKIIIIVRSIKCYIPAIPTATEHTIIAIKFRTHWYIYGHKIVVVNLKFFKVRMTIKLYTLDIIVWNIKLLQ